ncbi:MAG: sialidase family protein [Acidobacteriota bacterium]
MRISAIWFLVSMILMAGCVAPEDSPDAAGEPGMEYALPEVDMSTNKFLEEIEAGGGGVDFVFTPEEYDNQCHASTVAVLEDGSLISAWFWGSEEGKSDVGIWMSRYIDRAWGEIEKAARVMDAAHWNPVLFRDPARGLFLFFKAGPEIPFWQTFWMHSGDGGDTWSEPVELVPGDMGGRGPVKNKPIILSDGAWLAPASTEHQAWNAFSDRSEDGGKTWSRSEDIDLSDEILRSMGAIQPTLWESAPGNVHALMRTQAGMIARADSEDYGRTWSKAYSSGLPNNNSGIDVLKLEDGRILLVYNPVPEKWVPRYPLNMAVSNDNGETWKDLVSLETEEGEFSYPSIIRTPGGVAITYTWRRDSVRCWRIPLEALN